MGQENIAFVDEQISKLLKSHTVRVSDVKPRCILALQCVPKKNNKIRLVMDCRPINLYMNTPKFSQEGIDAVIDIVEADDEMITIDLTEGFHHIPIHPDHQQFLGFKWRNQYFVWQYLPFGVACAPYFFNKVIKPVVTYLRENGIRLAPFVDDFIVFLKRISATDHMDLTCQTFNELGWEINNEKLELIPSKERVFVGYIVSTKNSIPWIRTLPSKVRKLRRLISKHIGENAIKARSLARIIGQCIAMTKVVLPGKLLLRNCYRVLKTKQTWDSIVYLSKQAKDDLLWWLNSLKSWNGAPVT